MTRYEIIKKYETAIIEAMVKAYEDVVSYNGIFENDIYITENGEIETVETLRGDNFWLTEGLFFVTTVKVGVGFDIWDTTESEMPEDEDEAAEMEEELIENLVNEYRTEQVYVDYRGALDTALLED